MVTLAGFFDRPPLGVAGSHFDGGKHRKNSLAAWLPDLLGRAARSKSRSRHRGAPTARDLTAKARTELSFFRRDTEYAMNFGPDHGADWLCERAE